MVSKPFVYLENEKKNTMPWTTVTYCRKAQREEAKKRETGRKKKKKKTTRKASHVGAAEPLPKRCVSLDVQKPAVKQVPPPSL